MGVQQPASVTLIVTGACAIPSCAVDLVLETKDLTLSGHMPLGSDTLSLLVPLRPAIPHSHSAPPCTDFALARTLYMIF